MRRISQLAVILLISMSLPSFLFLGGCAGKQAKAFKTIEGDPEPLYKEALILFNKRTYGEAQKKFEQLKAAFPDSPPYSLWAELKIADCHFLRKEYVEAITSYEEFKKIHPTHEEIPYVQYQIGMSYFNQILTPDRDQTLTRKALASFEYLIANFPNHFFAERAKEKVETLKQRLADHEFYIGHYYYKEGKYQAAASRFQTLLEKHAKARGEDRTLMLLAKSYLELGEGERAKEALTRLLAQYPKSSYSKEAKSLIDKGLPERKRAPSPKALGKGEGDAGPPWETVALVKYEEEGRKPLSLKEELGRGQKEMTQPLRPLPVADEPTRSVPPKEESEKVRAERDQPKPVGKQERETSPIAPEAAKNRESLNVASLPSEEPAKGIPPKGEDRPFFPRTGPNPEDEERIQARPSKTQASTEKAPISRPVESGQPAKFEKGEPIDITSDRVESLAKENRILFKGNVMARQKDVVIYADDVEAVVTGSGKGIERVTARGHVKIQQGLRVANCEKAVFYNAEQKVVLTGQPKVWEGENLVAGEEIIFYVGQDRIEVKGGAGGKGKVRIQPKEEGEKTE